MAKKMVKHIGEEYLKVDLHDVAKGLGASVVQPRNEEGKLKVVFTEALTEVSFRGLEGLEIGSAFFPFEYLEGYDMDVGIVILSDNCEVWQNLKSRTFKFVLKNKLGRFLEMCISEDRVAMIKQLPSRLIFPYPTS